MLTQLADIEGTAPKEQEEALREMYLRTLESGVGEHPPQVRWVFTWGVECYTNTQAHTHVHCARQYV